MKTEIIFNDVIKIIPNVSRDSRGFFSESYNKAVMFDLGIKEESDLWGVSSTMTGRNNLDNSNIKRIQQGIVSGIAGYLIAEGERQGLDITALLSECNPMYPDARAALVAVEGVSELLDMEIPVNSLLEDARNIEEKVREAFTRANSIALPAPDSDEDDVSMY